MTRDIIIRVRYKQKEEMSFASKEKSEKMYKADLYIITFILHFIRDVEIE